VTRRAKFEAQVVSVAALGDPIRRALYEFVVSQAEPVNRDQAAEGVAVPRHTAKFHLDKLEAEGLLDVEFSRPAGRRGPGAGRPAKFYRRSSREIAVSLPERRYDLAGHVMARAITTAQHEGRPVTDTLRDAAREFGQSLGEQVRERVGSRPTQAKLATAIGDVLAESGYEPRESPGGVTLRNCPFHSLAQTYTSLVCGMNEDLLEGLLDTLPATKLRARLDPEPGRCCVTLQTTSGR
jgi:predicted ArsR family transcriptional regulator